MVIAALPAATQSSLALLDAVSTTPPLWIEIVLPHRSPTALMPFGLPFGTMTAWPVAMYGTASATCSRSSETYRADQTTSQRPAERSGISASKPLFTTSSVSPSLVATARAASTSKPVDLFGSVSSVEAKNSMGGYSMSTQSVSLPAVTRLVGGLMASAVGATEPGAADAGAVEAPWLGAFDDPPPPQAATNKAMAAPAASRWLSFTVTSSKGPRPLPARAPECGASASTDARVQAAQRASASWSARSTRES